VIRNWRFRGKLSWKY